MTIYTILFDDPTDHTVLRLCMKFDKNII